MKARWLKTRGFTLIEVLIVIVLISIISGVALITVSSNSKKQVETFAHQLRRLLTLAEQEAMLRSMTLGVAFSPDYFQFFQYAPTSDKDESPWKPCTEKIFGFHSIPDHMTLAMRMHHETIPLDGQPHIIISQSGDITPFVMTMAHRNDTPSYLMKGEASGDIHVEVYHEKN